MKATGVSEWLTRQAPNVGFLVASNGHMLNFADLFEFLHQFDGAFVAVFRALFQHCNRTIQILRIRPPAMC